MAAECLGVASETALRAAARLVRVVLMGLSAAR